MADGSAAFGSPTSRMCLQRTRQLGIFRQAITHFFRPLPGERRPAGRGVPIPAVRRVSKLVIGPTQGRARWPRGTEQLNQPVAAAVAALTGGGPPLGDFPE